MANPQHVKLLLSGKKAVADWREEFCSTMETEHDGLDLRDASLEGINLIGYDLTGADLENAKLSKAKLAQATLIEANLRNADLSKAYLSEAWCAGADFRGARLYRISAIQARFIGADMREACLMCACLGEACFDSANLEWANLIGADLYRTIFYRANLANAKLSGIVFDTDAIEEWNISNAKCYYYLRPDKESDRRERQNEKHQEQTEIEQARREGKKRLPRLVSEVPRHFFRIPEKGYLKGNEFEDLFKARRTVEFLFEHGMKALDPAILGAAIDLANSEHPSKGFRFLSIDARGGIPRAVIEIADKVSKDDALRLVQDYHQRVMEQMHKEIEGLRRDKESLLQIAARKTMLAVVGGKPPELTDTEENIIEALGNKTMKGPELLKKAGYDNSSHYRQILSNLVKRSILGRDANGYCIIDPD
jgi:uncharacterized protein YjbI with pentapeptide repeats